jgi:UDP-N-acetylglucosamine 1-carboxyvinyltransferase
MRASSLVLVPLVARFARPRCHCRGCAIGGRVPSIFICRGLAQMGAEISVSNGYIHATAKRLKGCRLVLDSCHRDGHWKPDDVRPPWPMGRRPLSRMPPASLKWWIWRTFLEHAMGAKIQWRRVRTSPEIEGVESPCLAEGLHYRVHAGPDRGRQPAWWRRPMTGRGKVRLRKTPARDLHGCGLCKSCARRLCPALSLHRVTPSDRRTCGADGRNAVSLRHRALSGASRPTCRRSSRR